LRASISWRNEEIANPPWQTIKTNRLRHRRYPGDRNHLGSQNPGPPAIRPNQVLYKQQVPICRRR
jgi:hypothetical protein